MSYEVIAPVAVVRIAGTDAYVYAGGILPDGVDRKSIEHLLSVGLIKQIEEPVEPVGRPLVGAETAETGETQAGEQAAEDLAKLDLNELRAIATDRKIDLQGATKKADIIAALMAPPAE